MDRKKRSVKAESRSKNKLEKKKQTDPKKKVSSSSTENIIWKFKTRRFGSE